MNEREINNLSLLPTDSNKVPSEEKVAAPSPQRFISRLWILAGILILIGAGAAYVIRFWQDPMGPRLNYSASSGNNSETAEYDTDVTPKCGGPPVMMLLLIGKDRSERPEEWGSYNSGMADVIRLARIDFVNSVVTVLAVPRDLWVPIPGMKDYGIDANGLRVAYAYGYTYLGDDQGPVLVAQTLDENFDVRIDHYIVLSVDAFVEGIDVIGGVDIYLDEGLYLRSGEEDYLAKGEHHFSGAQAFQYVHARPDNSSDLERMLRQTDLMDAVKEKVFSPAVFPSVPRIVRMMRRSVLTDLSPSEVSTLLCLGQQMESRDIQTVVYDTDTFAEITSRGGHEVFVPNYEATTAFFDAFERGTLLGMEAGNRQ